jgi:hypothetical protein
MVTGWVSPLAMPGGGKKDHGAVVAPQKGAVVAVQFVGGDPNNGRYWTGWWPADGQPKGTAVTDDGDRIVWRDGRIQITVDGTTATKLRVADQAAEGDGVLLELDIANRRLTLGSALGMAIATSGLLELDGNTVRINKRVVAPQGPTI